MKVNYINDSNQNNEYKRLFELLHEGEEHAIPMPKLAGYMGIDEMSLKNLICACRKEGNIICSSAKGYFFPENISEVEAFYNIMSARKKTTEDVLKPVRKLLKKEGRL